MLKGMERDALFIKLVEEGRYSVSVDGVMRKNTGKIIGEGKVHVVIGKDGNYFSITRTRAMWLVYKGLLPSDDYYVCYKDKEAPLHIDNLEARPVAELRSEAGKKAVVKLDPKRSAKMSDEQVLALRREFVANPKVFFIRRRAKEMNMAHATLSFALSGRTYKNVAEPVPKELMKKSGGNCKPRAWDRKTFPSYSKPRAPRPVVEKPIPPIKKVEVKTVDKPQSKPQPVKMTEQQKQDRLEMMKRIGLKKKSNVRSFD